MKGLFPVLPRVLGGSPSHFFSPDFTPPAQTLQATRGRTFPGSYLILRTGGKGANSKQGLCTPAAGGPGDCPLTLPPFPHGHRAMPSGSFAGDPGSPAAVGQQSLADTLAGKTKSSFVPFPLSPRQWHDSAGVKCFNGIQDSFCCPPAPRPFHPSLGARTNSQEEKACCVLH